MYLDLLVKRITKNTNIIEKVENLETVEEKVNYLIGEGYKKEELISEIERYFSVKHIDLSELNISKEFIKKLPNKYMDILVSENIFIFEENGRVGLVSASLPNRNIVSKVNEYINIDLPCYFAFDFEIKDKLGIASETHSSKSNLEGVNAWLEEVISFGVRNKASDIHIESKVDKMSVKYRIDGVLGNKKEYKMSEDDMSRIYVKIKILSDLNIAEKRKPQDGRIGDFISNGKPYDLRVSTVLTVLGEKIVLRLIDKTEKILGLNEIGFSDEESGKIKDLLDRQNGIIYMSGPTGSGKTTTLYGMIKYKDSDNINLYTIEDPVERGIEGINQITINEQAGITYASTLRALLRQDPDVIVIGEIRDEETAELASRGSLAGHLILATVHSNNAIETLPRLKNLGLDDYSLGTTTLGVISQRLVRVLCDCKEKYELTKREENWFKKNNFEIVQTYKSKGCPNCNDGYNGRTLISEILEGTGEVRDKIIEGDSLNSIVETAKENGFKTFKEVAYEKVKAGIISIEEAMIKSN